MTPTASVFIAISLDGFIAREDGNLDWLDEANKMVPSGEDCGYVDFIDSIDMLVMGRKTYEKVLSFGAWPYTKPVTVLSSREINIPGEIEQKVFYSSESPQVLCNRLGREGVRRIYVDGGITIQRFLSAGLIKDITITVIPVLIGSGIRLFGEIPEDIDLKHVSTKSYEFGFVQLSYEVLNNKK